MGSMSTLGDLFICPVSARWVVLIIETNDQSPDVNPLILEIQQQSENLATNIFADMSIAEGVKFSRPFPEVQSSIRLKSVH